MVALYPNHVSPFSVNILVTPSSIRAVSDIIKIDDVKNITKLRI